MTGLLLFVSAVVSVVALLLGWRRLWAWAVAHGWRYARGETPRRGNVIGGLGFEQVFEPEYEHVYEEQQSVVVAAEHEAMGQGR